MPLVADHEVFLNSALLCSDVHRRFAETDDRDVHSNRFFQRSIQMVNSKLSKGEVDDALIGAVGCLVLIEHCLEHCDRAAVHHSGMGELIRIQGGIQTIRYPLQMKIVRADIIPCVDRMKTPKLPHPQHTVQSLHATMFPNAPTDRAMMKALGAAGLNSLVTNVMLDVSAFCKALSYAIRHQLTVPYRSFDEDTMGFQYDLLLAPKDSLGHMDIACRSATLLYMKALTREDPVPNDFISNPMIAALKKITVSTSNIKTIFWITFIGGLFATNGFRRSRFKEELAHLRRTANLNTWKEAEAVLQNRAWVSEVHGSIGYALWSEFATMSTSTFFKQELTPPLTPSFTSPPIPN